MLHFLNALKSKMDGKGSQENTGDAWLAPSNMRKGPPITEGRKKIQKKRTEDCKSVDKVWWGLIPHKVKHLVEERILIYRRIRGNRFLCSVVELEDTAG